MSNIALSWAFKCHVGNASAKAVLVYLADRADDDGTAAYPKIATIVNVTELSERTVRTALKTLQERGFIRRGDQRYARLGKGGRNRLPQYCQIVWDLAVESDPSTLEWIKETHTAEHDPKTMGNTVDPAASTIMENGESKDVLPENAGTKPIPSTANLAGLEKGPEPALQIPQGQHCESCTPSTANAAPPALQISQSCIYKDKTLQVNPPSKPSFPSAPTGHLPASGETTPDEDDGDWQSEPWTDAAAEAEPPESESVKACSDAEMVCRTMADGLRAMPPMPVPDPLARPGKRELAAAQRLIARHGMPLVLAVAEWASLPPSKTDKGDASGKPYDGFWRRTLTGPRSLARHWDQVCLQMADDPHGRRLLAEHGILADKGETAQPPSAESTPKVPNYVIPDNLDRRVWKLLDPYDFDAGNDGFEAPRTLRRLLKRVPANDAEGERNAVLEALRAGRAFLDAVSREKDDGFGQRKPAETGPASGRVGFIGGRGPKEVPACS